MYCNKGNVHICLQEYFFFSRIKVMVLFLKSFSKAIAKEAVLFVQLHQRKYWLKKPNIFTPRSSIITITSYIQSVC